MNLIKLLKNIDYTTKDELNNVNISHITHNSKEVQNGALFIALSGCNTDGNNYINEAIQNGAYAIVSELESNECSIPYIEVNNSRKIMSEISNNFYRKCNKDIKIIGVTGTNGKTSICQIINHILNDNQIKSCTIGTLGLINKNGILNTNFTTPESNQIHHYLHTMKNNQISNAVIEVSSHALDLHRVDHVSFDVGVFSNLSPEHLDFHKNMDLYFKSKLKLFKKLNSNNSAILNIDDKYSDQIKENINCKIIQYSLNEITDIFPKNYNSTINGISALLNIFGKDYKINTELIGEYNLLNIMASIGSCIAIGVPIPKIINAINSFKSIPGRLERIDTHSKKKIFIDYAHTPDAYKKVLSTIKSFDYNLITLFGCGGNRDASNRSDMASIAEKYSKFVYITSDNPRFEDPKNIVSNIVKGFKNKSYKIDLNRKNAIKDAIEKMDDNDILLILGKGRENYELIKNKKIYHNDVEIIQNFA